MISKEFLKSLVKLRDPAVQKEFTDLLNEYEKEIVRNFHDAGPDELSFYQGQIRFVTQLRYLQTNIEMASNPNDESQFF